MFSTVSHLVHHYLSHSSSDGLLIAYIGHVFAEVSLVFVVIMHPVVKLGMHNHASYDIAR